MKAFRVGIVLSSIIACTAFGDPLWSPSMAKNLPDLATLGQKLQTRREEIASAIRAQERAKGKSSDPAKIEKKVNKEELIRALDEALALLPRASQKSPEQREALARLLILDQATQVQGRDRDLPRVLRQLKNIFKSWEFPITANGPAARQSSQNKMFAGSVISPAEIPREGLVFGANAELYAGSEVKFPPADVVLEYKKFRASQTKPKFDAIYVDGKKEREFKVKLTLETHSEITASALAASLGLYTDLSRHYPAVRVKFKSAAEWDGFLREWRQYYRDFSPEKSILPAADGKLARLAADGSVEVRFQRAILEAKDLKDIRRLGAWDWAQPEVRDDQAARAMLLFNFWVGNPDFLPENTKVLEKESGQFYYLIHDFGLSFSSLFAETINTYGENLVHRRGNVLDFKFFSWVDRAEFKHVTAEDLRWMARRIAALNRAQITAAVALGQWPAQVAHYLTEKLVARRNQIVEAFELEEEFGLLSGDPKFSTADGAVERGKLKKFFYDTYPERLGQTVMSMIAEHLGKPIKDAAIDGAAELIGQIERIPGDNQTFWDSHYLANVRLNSQREIERNTQATSSRDIFIVRDDVTIGFELGADFVVGGSAAALWKYTLLYPETDYASARHRGGFWVSLRSPSELDFSKIPQSAVLIVEKQIEGTGFLRTDRATGYFPIGMQVGKSVIPLKRLIVSRKTPGKVAFMLDHGTSGAWGAKLYANLGILKFPFATAKWRKGRTLRESFVISESTLARDADLLGELNHILKTADSADCDRLCLVAKKSPELENFSVSLNSSYSFALYSKKTSSQDERTVNHAQRAVSYDFTRDREKKWRFLDDGETFKLLVRAHAGAKPTERMIHLNFSIDDKDSRSPEIDAKYMRFIQGAFYQRLPVLHADAHASNGKWGATQLVANMVLDHRAIDALARIDIDAFERFARAQFPHFDFFGVFGNDSNHRSHARDVASYLRKLKTPLSPEARVHAATEALNRALLCVDGNWSGDLLGWIMSQVEAMTHGKGVYYNLYFGPAPFKENTFPAGKPWLAQFGEPIAGIESAFAQSDDVSSAATVYRRF